MHSTQSDRYLDVGTTIIHLFRNLWDNFSFVRINENGKQIPLLPPPEKLLVTKCDKKNIKNLLRSTGKKKST